MVYLWELEPGPKIHGGYNMKGVQFLIDEEGKKTAVLIDLKKHAELWEDFYNSALAQSREREPRETLESVKERLRSSRKLSPDA
jgi:hypothetical protein